MHKGIILLVKAGTPQEARDAAENQLNEWAERNEDSVDYGGVGGRWSGTLNPLCLKFMKTSSAFFCGQGLYFYKRCRRPRGRASGVMGEYGGQRSKSL